MSRNHEKLPRGEWTRLRQAAVVRDGYRCRRCGRPGRLEVDHKLPLRQGGTHDMDNLQTLCNECHIEKTRVENEAARAALPNRRYSPGWEEFIEELTS